MISAAILEDFAVENAHNRKVLEACPEEHFGWKPHEKSMALGQLAGHIVEAPGWIDGFLVPVFNFADIADTYQPFIPSSRAELMAEFDKTAAAFREHMEGKDDDFMNETWTMKMGDQVLTESPRHVAIRSFVIHHAIHHRGQLTVFLRLKDVPVPPTYGSTADVEVFS